MPPGTPHSPWQMGQRTVLPASPSAACSGEEQWGQRKSKGMRRVSGAPRGRMASSVGRRAAYPPAHGRGRPALYPIRGRAGVGVGVSRPASTGNPTPDGRPGVYSVVHFRNRAVGVVALDGEGRVLLVGQYRYTLSAYSWEIPEGEDALEAARRELREETGYAAGRWEPLLRTHLSNSVSDEQAFVGSSARPGSRRPMAL